MCLIYSFLCLTGDGLLTDSMAVFTLWGAIQAELFYTSHAILAEARFATSTKSHIVVRNRTHHFLEGQNHKSFVLEATIYKLYITCVHIDFHVLSHSATIIF